LPKQLRPKPGNRLLFGDRILDIYSVLDVDERGRTLGLLCVEQVESE
jgi:head-tail adaptor